MLSNVKNVTKIKKVKKVDYIYVINLISQLESIIKTHSAATQQATSCSQNWKHTALNAEKLLRMKKSGVIQSKQINSMSPTQPNIKNN